MTNDEKENSEVSENSSEPENNKTEMPAEAESVAEEATASANVEDAKNAAGNIVAKLMDLKESNPKVFFGAIGGVVIILLVLMMSGGSTPEIPAYKQVAVNIGQNYVLRSVNTSSPDAADSTVRLVAVPGSMAAYDDTEKDDRIGGCKHMAQGTPVKVLQTQDAYGKKAAFVQVEMTAGECKGQKGWVLAINIK